MSHIQLQFFKTKIQTFSIPMLKRLIFDARARYPEDRETILHIVLDELGTRMGLPDLENFCETIH